MKSGGVDLLSVEVLQMFLKDLISNLVCFTKFLQYLLLALSSLLEDRPREVSSFGVIYVVFHSPER